MATRISPAEWQRVLQDDPRMVATVLDVLQAQAKAARRGR